MANEQNLRPIPMNMRTLEDQKRIASMGGAANKKRCADNRSAKIRIEAALKIGKQYKLEQLKKMIKVEKDPDKLADLEFKKNMLEEAGLEIIQLFDIMSSRKTSPQSKLQAINSILDRTDGKPIQQTQISGANGEPITMPSIHIYPVAAKIEEGSK